MSRRSHAAVHEVIHPNDGPVISNTGCFVGPDWKPSALASRHSRQRPTSTPGSDDACNTRARGERLRMAKTPRPMRHEYRLIIEQDGRGSPLRVRLVGTDGQRRLVAESDPATALALRTAFRQIAEQITTYRDTYDELP